MLFRFCAIVFCFFVNFTTYKDYVIIVVIILIIITPTFVIITVIYTNNTFTSITIINCWSVITVTVSTHIITSIVDNICPVTITIFNSGDFKHWIIGSATVSFLISVIYTKSNYKIINSESCHRDLTPIQWWKNQSIKGRSLLILQIDSRNLLQETYQVKDKIDCLKSTFLDSRSLIFGGGGGW